MDLLETPLEAQLFTYSVTAASSLWTWLAFLTATAVGYWRIRTSVASKSDAPPTLCPAKPNQPGDDQPQSQAHTQFPAESPPLVVPCQPTLASAAEQRKSVEHRRKGTFFEARDCHVEDNGGWAGEEMAVEENDGDSVDLDAIYDGCWGLGVRRRRDLGWYRYQDQTALNGNVVRLWDVEDRRVASSPLRRVHGWWCSGSLG